MHPMARDAAKNKPGKRDPAVSVLIVAYQSGEYLSQCIAALEAQTFGDFEILMVDNASTDGAPQAAARAFPKVQLIEAGTNLGFAAGMNLAASRAAGDWLALINPDAFAAPDWLATLMEATRGHPGLKAFGCRQIMDDGSGRLDGLGDVMALPGFPFRGGYGHPDPGPVAGGEIFSTCGGAMLMDRATFDGLGGFDERLFCYCEDVDLGYRMRLSGMPSRVIPEAVVRHVGSASTGGPRSDFAVFHGSRNRIWVFIKNTPPVLFWLTLPLHILTTLVLFARHASRGELAAPMRGVRAAMAGLPMILAARRDTQAQRRVTSWDIARAMTWNPLDLLLRRVVIQRSTPR